MKSLVSTVTLFFAGLLMAGCSTYYRSEVPAVSEPIFSVATRQFPPEAPYNRVSWAVLPEPLPAEAPRHGPRMSQKLGLNLNNVRLDAAGSLLAKLFGYRTYCAAAIADRHVTLKDRGDLDELGEALATQASIRVVIDHENREVRLFALESAANS